MEMKKKNLVVLFSKDPENESPKQYLVNQMGEEGARNFYKNIVDENLLFHRGKSLYDFIVASKITKYFDNLGIGTIKVDFEKYEENLDYIFKNSLNNYNNVIVQTPIDIKKNILNLKEYFKIFNTKSFVFGVDKKDKLTFMGMNKYHYDFLKNYQIKDSPSEIEKNLNNLGIFYYKFNEDKK